MLLFVTHVFAMFKLILYVWTHDFVIGFAEGLFL